jgi:hypothetical protein
MHRVFLFGKAKGEIESPHLLVAKDATLSRLRRGFDSRWGRHDYK